MNESLVLESLRNDVVQVAPTLQAIAYRVLDEGISEFPIFVAAQEWIDIGRPIFDRDEVQINWFFNASILEEFTQKGIIESEKVRDFQKTFEAPREHACVFVIADEGAYFVFVPYNIAEEDLPE